MTNLPVVVLFMLVAWYYKVIPLKGAMIASLLVLLALSIASLTFYDLPLFGYRGFRCFLSAKGLNYQKLELYLVLTRSSLLAIIPFLTLYGGSKFGWLLVPPLSIKGCAFATGLLIGMTVFSVGF